MSTISISAGLPIARRRPFRRAGATPAPAPVSAAAPAVRLRLTRRGRLALTVLAVVGLVAAGVLAFGGPTATAGTEPGAAATAEMVTVRPGETLWAIAEREAPGVDPRETIAAIMDLNALESSAVAAGSVLLLPR